MNINEIIDFLKKYNGRKIRIMEVCGTHTSAIFKNGIKELISDRIELISGPGCPVCVTPTEYIDKCIEYAIEKDCHLLTFGDMMKVPGSERCLSEVKGEKNANIEMMYSPFESIKRAECEPDRTFVIAAVGFETIAPAYGLLIRECCNRGINNIKLLTSLKTIIPAMDWLCETQSGIDGFLCPGHVSVIIGNNEYERLSEKYKKPFVVAGFEGEHILAAIYEIVKQIVKDKPKCRNLYREVVKENGNIKALKVMADIFEPGDAMWRGLGIMSESGLYIKDTYRNFDAGSRKLFGDRELPKECKCNQVIIGNIRPDQCNMFGTSCSPTHPYGPCMVSSEGACGIWYQNIY